MDEKFINVTFKVAYYSFSASTIQYAAHAHLKSRKHQMWAKVTQAGLEIKKRKSSPNFSTRYENLVTSLQILVAKLSNCITIIVDFQVINKTLILLRQQQDTRHFSIICNILCYTKCADMS